MKRTAFIAGLLCCLASRCGAAPPAHWVGTWSASPMACPVKAGDPSPADSTYRNVLRVSIGGHGLRVLLTNEFGSSPLLVDSAHVGIDAGGGYVKSGSDRTLTFNGHASATIPENGSLVSDEVAMEVAPLTRLAITLHIPAQQLSTPTCHLFAYSSNFVAAGNQAAAAKLSGAHIVASWAFVKGVEVRADPGALAVVALGDSITDGHKSTRDANRRWTDYLARRLQRSGNRQVAVLNEGITGNRVLHSDPTYGESAIARFDRDVLAQSGVRCLIVLEGINDLDWRRPQDNASAGVVIDGLAQLVLRAHAHGIRVYLATLTPYFGEQGYTADGERTRNAINDWIRDSGIADGVIDFDKLLRKPSNPSALRRAYDSGDHQHPSDSGYEAMADSIDLSLFH